MLHYYMRDTSMYNRRRIFYITILLHLINLKAHVIVEYDGQPIDMHVSLHVNCCDFSKNTNFHTRTPSNIATYLCTPICESNMNSFCICHVKHNPLYLECSRTMWYRGGSPIWTVTLQCQRKTSTLHFLNFQVTLVFEAIDESKTTILDFYVFRRKHRDHPNVSHQWRSLKETP